MKILWSISGLSSHSLNNGVSWRIFMYLKVSIASSKLAQKACSSKGSLLTQKSSDIQNLPQSQLFDHASKFQFKSSRQELSWIEGPFERGGEKYIVQQASIGWVTPFFHQCVVNPHSRLNAKPSKLQVASNENHRKKHVFRAHHAPACFQIALRNFLNEPCEYQYVEYFYTDNAPFHDVDDSSAMHREEKCFSPQFANRALQ